MPCSFSVREIFDIIIRNNESSFLVSAYDDMDGGVKNTTPRVLLFPASNVNIHYNTGGCNQNSTNSCKYVKQVNQCMHCHKYKKITPNQHT